MELRWSDDETTAKHNTVLIDEDPKAQAADPNAQAAEIYTLQVKATN